MTGALPKQLSPNAKMLPEYWGRWFSSVEGSDMKQTDLHIFYRLGAGLQDIRKLLVGASSDQVMRWLFIPEKWLEAFLRETETENDSIPLVDSRKAAKKLFDKVRGILLPIYNRSRSDSSLSPDEYALLHAYLEEFESEFERECRQLDVFTVTQKGLLNPRLLIEKAEKQFPENLIKVMPQQTIEDLRQSGRCLAFEAPTACAFHACRGTEALMLRYYEVLAGKKWSLKEKNWGAYNRELIKLGAPKSITNRLDELRKDRNSYAHPNETVAPEDAPIVFTLCHTVMLLMAKEIEKLQTP